jgi:hypothetical protein
MIAEEISGDNSPCHPKALEFMTPETAPENCTLAISETGNLTIQIKAGAPTMYNYFLRQLQLTVTRTPYSYSCPTNPDGAVACPSEVLKDLDTVQFDRWVPVMGNLVISGGVPKTFTVPTGNRLIFNILHDPPGGLSSATWEESSSMGFNINIAGMEANSEATTLIASNGVGIDAELEAEVAPFGMGLDMEILAGGAGYEVTEAIGDPVSERSQTKESGWAVSLTLTKSISTSDEPSLAGKASDVILGGGLELQFTEILKIVQDVNSTGVGVCLTSEKVLVWEPAKMTTFLLPVHKIADEMRRIKAQSGFLKGNILSSQTGQDSGELTEQVKYLEGKYADWVAVMKEYENTCNHTALQDQKSVLHTRIEDMIQRMHTLGDNEGDLTSLYQDDAKKGAAAAATAAAMKAGIISDSDGSSGRDEDAAKATANTLEDNGKADYDSVLEATKKMKKDYDDLQHICFGDFTGVSTANRMHVPDCQKLMDHPWSRVSSLVGPRISAKNYVNEGMPGTPPATGFLGEFDALRDSSSSPNPAYITFAGGGETLTFSHEIEATASLSLALALATTAQTLETDESNFDLSLMSLDRNWNYNTERDFNEITDDSSTRAYDSAFTSSVSYTLGDEVRSLL